MRGEPTEGAAIDDAVKAHRNGATVSLRVVPRATKTGFDARDPSGLKLRLKAPPVEDAANNELCKFLARLVGVPPSNVSVLKGGRNREKVVLVRGASAETLRQAIVRAVR